MRPLHSVIPIAYREIPLLREEDIKGNDMLGRLFDVWMENDEPLGLWRTEGKLFIIKTRDHGQSVTEGTIDKVRARATEGPRGQRGYEWWVRPLSGYVIPPSNMRGPYISHLDPLNLQTFELPLDPSECDHPNRTIDDYCVDCGEDLLR